VRNLFSFFFFFFPKHDGHPTLGPSQSFSFGLVGSFDLPFLVTFKSEFLNGEHVIISDRLAHLTLLMAPFAFGRGKIFDGEILAPSAFSTLPSGGEIFWRIFKDVCPLLLSSQ
jgi:hypothetical protein